MRKKRKIERAVTKYRDGEVSLMRAAEMAGVTIWESLEILGKRGISLRSSLGAVEESLWI